MMESDRNIKRLLIRLILYYLLITYLFSIIGPITYNNYDIITTSMFVLFFLLSIYLGYHSYKSSEITKDQLYKPLSNIIIIISIAAQLLLLFDNIRNYGLLPISFDTINASYKSMKFLGGVEESVIRKICTIITPLFFMCIIDINRFKRKALSKIPVISVAVLYAINNIIYLGAQEYIAQLFILIMIPYFPKLMIVISKHKVSMRDRFVIICFTYIIILIFSITLHVRIFSSTVTVDPNVWGGLGKINLDSWILKPIPSIFRDGFAYLFIYISGGYYLFNLCSGKLNLIPGIISGCPGLASLWATLTGASESKAVTNALYSSIANSVEINYGVNVQANWFTCYTYLISAFSVLGCLFVLFLMGRVLSKVWDEVLNGQDILSLLMFERLISFFLYLPANNHILWSRTDTIVTIVVFTCWIIKKRIRLKKEGFKNVFIRR